MGYQETKAFINANIKPNGENEITGSILNTALNDVLDSGHEEVNQLDQKSVEIGNSGNLADLDIADENGNILARLSSGNIKTKNFDSATTPKIDVSDEADFEVADDDNNVLLQLKGGHIKTKNFDSAQLGQAATHIVHFSFDDGEYSIIHLFANNYSSVWDSPFFGFLKTLHQYFGAVFTINLFISTFSVITNRYATELGAAASWLKFSLHGDKTQNYGEPGGLYPGGRTSGGQDWTDMVSAVVTLTGTPNAIDRHTRLSNFAGTETNLLNMRDNKFGAICFSAADEYPRLSYDFDNNEEKFVWDNEFYFNSKTRLYFVRSYARLDDLTINSATLATMKSYIEQRGFSEFFIHEYSVYNSNGIVNAGVTKLNAFFNFIHSNNYKCDFFKLTI